MGLQGVGEGMAVSGAGMVVACAGMVREGFRDSAESVLKLKGQEGHLWARLM